MKKTVQWTTEQSQAFDVDGQNDRKKTIVSASAGSGKTTVMIERILRLILKGESLENMLICTFTKASAMDMKDKLYKKLVDYKENPNAQKALQGLTLADISTIDSWCQRLIKTHFYCIEVDPDFDIISTQEKDNKIEEIILNLIAEYLESDDSDFATIYEVMLSSRKTTMLVELLSKIYEMAVVQPDPFKWLDDSINVLDNHEEYLKSLNTLVAEKIDYQIAECEKLREDFIKANFVVKLQDIDNTISCMKNHELLLDLSRTSKKDAENSELHLTLANKLQKGIREKYKSLLKEKAEYLSSSDPTLTKKYVVKMIEMAKELFNRYSDFKQKKGFMDYSDLEHSAYKILCNTDALDIINKKYRYVFVDEYQDVNPLQDSIFEKLDAKKFFVGDVKQSIYSFRMCDPTIFSDKQEKWSGENDSSKAIKLNSNFRSYKEILDFSDNVFSKIMTKKFGNVDYKNTAMFNSSNNKKLPLDISCKIVYKPNDKIEPQEEVYSVENHQFSQDDLSRNTAQSNLITNQIFDIINTKFTDNGQDKYAKFSDIAILTRGVKHHFFKTLIDNFVKHEIPYSVSEKNTHQNNYYIMALVDYLKLIDNQFDDIVLASVLRSDFGGFTDDDLASVRLFYPDGFFYEAVEKKSKDIDDLGKRLCAFYKKLEEYQELSFISSVADLAGKICTDYFYFKIVASKKDGEIKSRELEQFLNELDNNVYSGTLFEVINKLDKFPLEFAQREDEDTIKIMTIHSSKGLEFPFVILANVCTSFNAKDYNSTVLLDSKMHIALPYWDINNRKIEKTSLGYVSKQAIKYRLLQEEMRLLYVALTRAKFGMFIFGSMAKNEIDIKAIYPFSKPPSDSDSFFEFLNYYFYDKVEFVSHDVCNLEDNKIKQRLVIKNGDTKLVECINQYVGFEYQKSLVPVKGSVTGVISQTKDDLAQGKIYYVAGAESDDRAIDKGNAYHKILENMDFNSSDFMAEELRLKQEFSTLLELVDFKVIQSAFNVINEKFKGAQFYKEIPFTYKANAKELGFEVASDNGVLIQGIIDLLIRHKNEYYIVDYKSGILTEEKNKNYKKQLEIYTMAVNDILKVKTKKSFIFSLLTSEFVEIV